MLVKVANSLVDGGETGVFSPMHLLVFRKPEAKPQGEGSNGRPAAAAADKASDAATTAEKAAKGK